MQMALSAEKNADGGICIKKKNADSAVCRKKNADGGICIKKNADGAVCKKKIQMVVSAKKSADTGVWYKSFRNVVPRRPEKFLFRHQAPQNITQYSGFPH
jgi:hypothetical protein